MSVERRELIDRVELGGSCRGGSWRQGLLVLEDI